jgi:hypothetical protein
MRSLYVHRFGFLQKIGSGLERPVGGADIRIEILDQAPYCRVRVTPQWSSSLSHPTPVPVVTQSWRAMIEGTCQVLEQEIETCVGWMVSNKRHGSIVFCPADWQEVLDFVEKEYRRLRISNDLYATSLQAAEVSRSGRMYNMWVGH